MDKMRYIQNYLNDSLSVKNELAKDTNLMDVIKDVAELFERAYRAGNKILIAGNGGSAGDAQHIAAEFVSRFFYDRRAYRHWR